MAKKSTAVATKGSSVPAKTGTRTAKIAAKGIKTGHDFADLMSALMSDLVEGNIPPNIGNATCNAGGKLLKVVEMQIKYGVAGPNSQRILTLSLGSPLIDAATRPTVEAEG